MLGVELDGTCRCAGWVGSSGREVGVDALKDRADIILDESLGYLGVGTVTPCGGIGLALIVLRCSEPFTDGMLIGWMLFDTPFAEPDLGDEGFDNEV